MKHFTYVHVRRPEKSRLCLVETLFIDEIPHLVFRDEHDPKITQLVALDPKRFHRHGGRDHSDAHIYEIAVDDPRNVLRPNQKFHWPDTQQLPDFAD